jgi:cation diffusion facilitator family transporter
MFGDGIHNLSDVLTLGVAFWADRMEANYRHQAYTYGSSRFEILGGMINSIFLVATSVYVILEAVPALIWPEQFKGGSILIIMAAIGFSINLLATIFFGGHHHGHSHGSGAKEHYGHYRLPSHIGDESDSENSDDEHEHDHIHSQNSHEHSHTHNHSETEHVKKNVNTYAVFLHFLGDALSSLCIMISGIIAKLFPNSAWVSFVDPIASLVIVGIMITSCIPLLYDLCKVILQRAPDHLDMKWIEQNIIAVDSRIKSTKNLHVWQMSYKKIVCIVRIKVQSGLTAKDIGEIIKGVRKLLMGCEFQMHDVTVEPVIDHHK